MYCIETTRSKIAIMKIITLIFIFTAVGCSTFSFPGVHRISVQQGNVITQMMIDKLKPGMTRSQVRYILGNPVLDDALNRDRWNYVYTIQISGGEIQREVLVLHFLEEELSVFETSKSPSKEN